MQFYIINENPIANAQNLPAYALRKVNIREGWQILSDVGRRFGVTWPGQNEPYNPFHSLTRTFSNQLALMRFVAHYHACCIAYEARGFGQHMYIDAFRDFIAAGTVTVLCDALPADEYAETRHYLRTRKAKHLTDAEAAGLN
jgi:hypothetical protein